MTPITSGPGRPTHPLRLLYLCWTEARPIVQLIFLLRFLAGAVLGGEGFRAILKVSVLLAALTWLFTTWTIYLLNGVADIVEDRENQSRRPIARGDLPQRTARTVVGLLAALSLVAGTIQSTTMLILVALMLGLGWLYSMGPRPLKGNIPGFVVSVTALGLLTYAAGWHASGTRTLGTSVWLFGTMMSLWMGLGGWTKDLPDIRGDRLAGRRSLPVILGDRTARQVMAATASMVGWGFGILGVTFMCSHLFPATTTVWAGSIGLALAVLRSPRSADRSAKRLPYRIFMLTQYTAHIVLFATAELPACCR
jgi:4-hydroxybenzoate polyprenyltransferase